MVTCGACQREVAAGATICLHCGNFLDQFSVQPDQTVTLPSQPPSDPTPPPSADGGIQHCSEPSCGFEVYPGQRTCLLGHPVATQPAGGSGAELALPGGARVRLEPGVPVEIGRHSADPTVAEALGRFDAVSRRQAVVVLEGSVLRVTHVGRTNPTYVNGRPVSGSVMAPLPVDLRLGQTVQLRITKGE